MTQPSLCCLHDLCVTQVVSVLRMRSKQAHSCKMDTRWDLYVTAIFLSAILMLGRTCWRKLKGRQGGSSVPPGSSGWPFIGENIEFFSSAYSDRMQSFMNKRQQKYGKVFKTHIFGSPTIVSTDAEVNKIILQADTRVFVPSYTSSLHDLMGKSSFLFMSGRRHRRFHGLVGAFYKSQHLKDQITRDMEKYVKEAMSGWKGGHLVHIQDETLAISFHIQVKAILGLEPGETVQFLKQQFEEYIAGFVSFPINIPGSQLYRSLEAKKKLVKLVQEIVYERKKININPTAPVDALDVLLNDDSEQFSLDQISENVIDLITPGEESVPALIAIIVKYLSDCPAALQELMEENMTLKSQKARLQEPFHSSDYMSLRFTQAVITETLRMANIFFGVKRKAMKDMEVKGYRIPKGWCVLTYFRSIHFDESIHKCPDQFNPWRWQNMEMNVYNFSPFGGGERLCPGRDLARLQAAIFLHHLVTQFGWVAENDSIVSIPAAKMRRRMPIWVERREDFELPQTQNQV